MEQRKCMMCGAELGEREKYCGNCGAKAPDGALDKEEIEFKAITPNEQNPPEWSFSWDAHYFFCKQGTRKKIATLHSASWFEFFMMRYVFYGMAILILNIYYFIEIRSIDFSDIYKIIIDLIFIELFFNVCGMVYRICDNLLKFKKNAPAMLYIHCGIRIIVFPAYAIFSAIIDRFHPIIGWLALFEGLAGLIALIISIKYYEKRKKVFIN